MVPKFPPRDPLGPDKVVYHCSICRRTLWPDEAIRMPQPDTPTTSPLRKWDGFVFCLEHAAERGIS